MLESQELVIPTSTREVNDRILELERGGLNIAEIRKAVASEFGSSWMPTRDHIVRLKKRAKLDQQQSENGQPIHVRTQRPPIGPYNTASKGKGKARQRAKEAREKEKRENDKRKRETTEKIDDHPPLDRLNTISFSNAAGPSCSRVRNFTDAPLGCLNIAFVASKSGELPRFITKVGNKGQDQDQRQRNEKRLATNQMPISKALLLIKDTLPENVQALITYESIKQCNAPGIIQMSKMGCIARQVGSIYQRYTHNTDGEKNKLTLSTRFRHCVDGEEPCTHWLSDADYRLVINKIKKYRQDIASKVYDEWAEGQEASGENESGHVNHKGDTTS